MEEDSDKLAWKNSRWCRFYKPALQAGDESEFEDWENPSSPSLK